MLAPLRSVNDQRFSWLQNVFLKLFQGWLNSAQKRQDAGQKNVHINRWAADIRMIEISVNLIIEATQFLL